METKVDNKMEITYGFLTVPYTGDPVECADTLCTRLIFPEEIVYIDTQDGAKMYCKLCGPCERYHRKKAEERGENLSEAN